MTATTLTVGDLGIIAVNTQDTVPGGTSANDLISFVLLAPMGSGTTVYFTDRSWSGSSFTNAAGDGTYAYTAGSDLAAGTVVTISTAQLSSAGISLSESGETIYAYQGTSADAPTKFLHAVDIADGTATFDGSELANTGLVSGTSALAIAVNNAEFGTRTSNINSGDLFTQINTNTDWVQNDNSMQDGSATGTPAYTAPDAQIWVAGSGAGEAVVTINLDATYSSGTLGYQIVQAFQNDANLYHPSDITLDTVHGKFFFVDSDNTGHNRIVEGSISQLLNSPGAGLTLTVLYADDSTASPTNSHVMHSLSVDTANGIIYFDHGTTFDKINYSLTGSSTGNQTPTVLANLGTGNYVTQVAIDYTHGEVYLGSSRVSSFFGDTVDRNYVYVATGLTASSTALTFAQLPFNPDDTNLGPEGSPLSGEAWPVERGTIRGIDVDPVNHDLYIVTGSVSLDNDGDGSTTYYGGVYKYDLDSNSTGTVTTLFTQDGSTGPVGLLYYVEVDPTTNRYYVIDQTGTNADPGDGGVWTGSTLSAGTPTLVSIVGNVNGLGPTGLEIQHAPTLAGANLGVTITETAGNPSPNPTPVTPANNFQTTDVDSASDANNDQLAGAQVRISGNFLTGAGHADQLLYGGTLASGTSQNGTISIGGDTVAFSYDATTGTLTFSGVTTFDNYETILAGVQYRVDGDNPTDYGDATTRTISYSTFDGLLYSDEVNATVTVTGVNDAPTNTPGSAATAFEDFATNAVTGISISDVDADPAADAITVTLSVSHGTLTLLTNVSNGITAGQITGGANGSGTITVTATQNQLNATLAAFHGLLYVPTSNYNGADSLVITSNDNGNTGTDAGLSGTAASEEDQDSKVINIVAINDAPTVGGDGTEALATILEDTPLASANAPTVATVFGGQYSDATDLQQTLDNPTGSLANGMAGIAITANGSSANTGQWQYLFGASWLNVASVSDSLALVLAAGTQIRFNPAPDYNGTAPTLTVHFIDDSLGPVSSGTLVDISAGDATGGTTRYSTGTVVVGEAITPVNDPPTSTHLQGDSVTWTEGDSPVILDTGSDATVADIDSANFDTGKLTIGIAAGGVTGEDGLSIQNQGTGAGQIGVSGANVTFGGATIGTVSGGSAGADLVITFNANADSAAVQALVRDIQYANAGGDDPTEGDRTITWQLVDGDGTANGGNDTLTVTSTIHVVAVDDPPVVHDDAVSTAENAVLNGDVTADNGNGADTDPDDPLQVSEVNGTAADVGNLVTLASGALLTVNSDGTFAYDPNGQFDHLVSLAKATATGALNVSATDSFTYALAGGGTATVEVTVNGVDSAGDWLLGDGTNNTITGTDVHNTIFGGGGDDALTGGASWDRLNGEGGGDTLNGGQANDVLDGGAGADTMTGGKGDDIYYVDDAGDVVVELPGGGTDLVRTSIDGLVLADNVENLKLLDGATSATGNGLDNELAGRGNGDTLHGAAGADFLQGLGGADFLYGDGGDDTLNGGSDNDWLYGGDENDTLDGAAGTDRLFGAGGNDTLDGGSGYDRIEGGAGQDTLTGGSGNDRFFFSTGDTSPVRADADHIADFSHAEGDLIDLHSMDANGPMSANQAFTFIGTAAFDGTAGELRYEEQAGVTYVEGDTTGDGVADFTIAVDGSHALVAADFLL